MKNMLAQKEMTGVRQERESGIELFRIITMLVIIAHHYVINSGLIDLIRSSSSLSANSIFLLLFGWGGKTGINCFVLITGYFMCKSNITLKKFLKLFLEVEFYNIVIYLIFLLSGYEAFSLKSMLKSVTPFYTIGTNFISSYLAFFLFIPFLNILIRGMDKKMHLKLIGLCICVYTLLPTVIMAPVVLSYVSWFMVIYCIGAYIRLYPQENFASKRLWGLCTAAAVFISWCSVLVCSWLEKKIGYTIGYYFVSDSNKILALVTAVCAFMYFKNLNIKYNKVINTVAASTFGVLLLHANSDTMRRWLWKDVFNNTAMINSQYLIVHAFGVVAGVYIICTLIDMLRIRYIEKPFFALAQKAKIIE